MSQLFQLQFTYVLFGFALICCSCSLDWIMVIISGSSPSAAEVLSVDSQHGTVKRKFSCWPSNGRVRPSVRDKGECDK